MKYTLILILTAGLAFNACKGETSAPADSGVRMYVTAKSGLLIRAEATVKSAKKGLVPMGDTVRVLETAQTATTIAGKTGHWQRVEYKGTEGWAFGGFLSATPVEKLAANQIKVTFIDFEFGDTAHYTFEDEDGKDWVFKDNRSELDFHVETESADQGYAVNQSMQNRTFIITYKTVRQQLYPDGPVGDVKIITDAKPAQ